MADNPTPKSAPSEKTVRLYNRFESRELIHGAHRAPPAQFTEVPESVANTWKRLFPDHIVDAGTAQKEIGGLQAQISEKDAQIAELQKQLAALKAGKGNSPKPSEQI